MGYCGHCGGKFSNAESEEGICPICSVPFNSYRCIRCDGDFSAIPASLDHPCQSIERLRRMEESALHTSGIHAARGLVDQNRTPSTSLKMGSQSKLTEAQTIEIFRNIGWYFYHWKQINHATAATRTLPFPIPDDGTDNNELNDLLSPYAPHAGESFEGGQGRMNPYMLPESQSIDQIPGEFLTPSELAEVEGKRGRFTPTWWRSVRMTFTHRVNLAHLRMEWGQIGRPSKVAAIFDFLRDFGIPEEVVRTVEKRI